MNDPDPAQAASLEELAKCLRQLHIRAGKPALRELQDRTKHVNGLLPGTPLKRVMLGRTTSNDVLRGVKFPKKAFLLTMVEALNINLEADRRWEEAWDRLAVQELDQAAEAEAGQLRQQLDRAEGLLRRRAAAETQAQEQLSQAITAHAAELDRLRAEAADRLEKIQAEKEAALRQAEAEIAKAARAAGARIAAAEQQAAAAEARVRTAEADRDRALSQATDLEGQLRTAEQRAAAAEAARAHGVTLSFEEAIEGLTVTFPPRPEIRLQIPPAVTDGQEFRSRHGFYAVVKVRPHPVFGRDGDNLTVTVPVTHRELALGAVIKVPALRRPPVNLRLPPGTPGGRRFRVQGRGVHRADGNDGDLIITVREVKDASKADEIRAELCAKAAGDTVTVNPVRDSLAS
jgi:hypothetical protein